MRRSAAPLAPVVPIRSGLAVPTPRFEIETDRDGILEMSIYDTTGEQLVFTCLWAPGHFRSDAERERVVSIFAAALGSHKGARK